MFETLHAFLTASVPNLFHQYAIIFAAFATIITAPFIAKIVVEYPYRLEKGYREEAESIVMEPAVKGPKQPAKWLLPGIVLVTTLILILPWLHSETWLQTVGAFWISMYIAVQFFTSFHSGIHLEELNRFCLWIGLLFSTFNTYIPADQAIYGAAGLYSIFWIIESAPWNHIKKITSLCSPLLASVLGAFLGFKTGGIAILIGLGISSILTIIQAIISSRLLLLKQAPSLFPLLPSASGPLFVLWFFLFC